MRDGNLEAKIAPIHPNKEIQQVTSEQVHLVEATVNNSDNGNWQSPPCVHCLKLTCRGELLR